MIEVESEDMDFIENEFLTKGRVDKILELYEMIYQKEGAPSKLAKNKEEILQTPRDSSSNLQPSGNMPLEENSQQSQSRRSKHANIPLLPFEIEGNLSWLLHKMMMSLWAYRTVQEALLSSEKIVMRGWKQWIMK